MENQFATHSTPAKIQGLSIQVGELFSELYRQSQDGDKQQYALEAYRNLRRLLPVMATTGRHMGSMAAHASTQKGNIQM